MATLAFRPIAVTFTRRARHEMRAFVAQVSAGAWGDESLPLEPAIVRIDPVTGRTATTRKPGFIFGAIPIDAYREPCALALPRLATLDDTGFLLKLPPQAAILDRIDFDWREDRLLALN